MPSATIRRVLRAAALACLCAMPLVDADARDATDAKVAPKRLRVLFVGNSYLYTHALPQVAAAVAAARGVELVPGMLAKPNYALEDHLAEREYEAMLQQGWDWVVLQQGPSSLPDNRVNLRVYSGRAANLARARGIRVALMSAWPALQNVHTWLDAELSYRNAAIANDVCVLPVASAWRLSRAQWPAIRLYQPDQLHPEREGTLLAALVIVHGLIDRPRHAHPPDVAATIPAADWRPAVAQATALDRISDEALSAEGPRCGFAKR